MPSSLCNAIAQTILTFDRKPDAIMVHYNMRNRIKKSRHSNQFYGMPMPRGVPQFAGIDLLSSDRVPEDEVRFVFSAAIPEDAN